MAKADYNYNYNIGSQEARKIHRYEFKTAIKKEIEECKDKYEGTIYRFDTVYSRYKFRWVRNTGCESGWKNFLEPQQNRLEACFRCCQKWSLNYHAMRVEVCRCYKDIRSNTVLSPSMTARDPNPAGQYHHHLEQPGPSNALQNYPSFSDSTTAAAAEALTILSFTPPTTIGNDDSRRVEDEQD